MIFVDSEAFSIWHTKYQIHGAWGNGETEQSNANTVMWTFCFFLNALYTHRYSFWNLSAGVLAVFAKRDRKEVEQGD